MKRFSTSLLLVFSFFISYSQTKNYRIHSVAFYNLENLFDTINNPDTNDEASPMFEIKKNRSAVYYQKLKNMARVISEIGSEKTHTAPSIIGIAEIENRNVLEDLIQTPPLNKFNYGIIHYDSPDLRGIDVALLYRKEHFIPMAHHPYEMRLWSENGIRKYTRDQLLVSGYLEEELIHIIVNHWPSRRGGEKRSRPNREKAAFLNKTICDSIFKTHLNSKIILMGDLNDDPINASLKNSLGTKKDRKHLLPSDFYNPYEVLFERGFSTLGFRDNINLFDQIILSGSLVPGEKDFSTLSFYKAYIYNPAYLSLQSGKYKGYPFRSFGNGAFTGGYSDHYPVFVYLIKEKNH